MRVVYSIVATVATVVIVMCILFNIYTRFNEWFSLSHHYIIIYILKYIRDWKHGNNIIIDSTYSMNY